MTKTMTNDDEEKMLIDKVMSARHELSLHVEATRIQTLKKNQIQSYSDSCEQALIDFYASCGVTKSECGDFTITIGESTSVDVTHIESVPEKYIRTKTTKEINKALIKAENTPANNWLSYKITPKLTIKHKES